MKLVPLLLVALAAAAIVASCSTPATLPNSPGLKSGWPDAGTPASTVATRSLGVTSSA